MSMNHLLIRIIVLMIVTALSYNNQEAQMSGVDVDNGQCVVEIETPTEGGELSDKFSIDNTLEENRVAGDGQVDANDTPQPTAPTEIIEKSNDESDSTNKVKCDDGLNSEKTSTVSNSNKVIQSTKPATPAENNAYTQSNQSSSNNNVSKEEDYSTSNNASYDGDTAVPPDAVGDNDNVDHEVKVCKQHDFVLTETTVNNRYDLYNYVTDYYRCKNCDNTKTDVHIASADVPKSVIDNAEKVIIDCVNQLRTANGLNKLWVSDDWNVWANTRSVELESFYGHRRPNGGDWLYAIGDHYTIGENIASGQASGVDFYTAFYNSAQHKDLMLAEDAIGIAVSIHVNNDGSTYCAMIVIGSY